jgi:pimeloyl-ACP methyl ester carboxylesterase
LVARFFFFFFSSVFATNVYCQVIDVPHANEAPTRTLLVAAQNPKALVLLFPGGGGVAGIFDNGSAKSRHTFVRSINLWSQYGIDAVLVDSPYDLGDLRRGNLRGRQDHLSRVNEVIAFYKAKFQLPIWIFGHSMGTSTVTNYANGLPAGQDQIAGIIIAGTIHAASLNKEVSLPVLGIHHALDACAGTPLSATADIVQNRPPKTTSQLEVIEGGITEGNVCDSFAYHGFNQTEPELVKRAAQFILSH